MHQEGNSPSTGATWSERHPEVPVVRVASLHLDVLLPFSNLDMSSCHSQDI